LIIIGENRMALSKELDIVQKSIITIHRVAFDESPTPMKLQKLCYYAQGYSLAEGRELFPEDFQAWQHGPVIVELWSNYKGYQWRQIMEEVPELPCPNSEFLSDVVSAYGRFDGAALSTMTHRESPWLDARGDRNESEGCNEVISKHAMKTFFAEKLRANSNQ
jgi:uncharacterized phage-associated protein